MSYINKAFSWLQRLIIGLLRFYQYCISPFLGKRCRFWPSCSDYAIIAIKRFGLLKGGWLTFKRLCKCHPWHDGGIDEVPSINDGKRD